MEYEKLNVNLKDIAQKALNTALDSLDNGKNTFSPFLIYEKDKKVKLKRFQSGNSAEAFNMALEYIEDMEDAPFAIALAYMDDVTLKDGRFPAIMINIYGDEEDSGYSYGQIYKIEAGAIMLLNKIMFLGNIRNALLF
jgi:hypothetical protein